MNSQKLRQNSSGEMEYDFGSECCCQSFEALPTFMLPALKTKKRQQITTPLKGRRRKMMVTSTPNQSKPYLTYLYMVDKQASSAEF